MTKPEDANAKHPDDGVVEGDDLLGEAAGGINDHGYDPIIDGANGYQAVDVGIISEGGWRV
jgi:hypothetical protein